MQQMFLIRGKGEKKKCDLFSFVHLSRNPRNSTQDLVCLVDQDQLEYFVFSRLVTCLHGLPRGVVESLSLEVFKAELDITLL